MMSGRRFDVTGSQVAAAVLATVTGTVAASYLGIAGTVIGAAVMSVVTTVGGSVYRFYIARTAGRLRSAAPVIGQRVTERVTAGASRGPARAASAAGGPPPARPAGPVPPADSTGPVPLADSAGPVPPASATGPVPPARPAGEPAGAPGRSPRRGAGRPWPRWLLVMIGSAALFVAVLAAVTAFEAAAGKPLDSFVWHRSGSGTTIGRIVGTGQQPAARRPSTPAPRTSPSGRPSGSRTVPSPSTSPSPAATSPAPSATPTPTGASPSSSPAGAR